MKKYLRLLRIQDQYMQLTGVFAAAAYLKRLDGPIFWWAAATTLLSFSAFILNEIVDRTDTDRFSWNKIHVIKETFSPVIVGFLFALCGIGGLFIAWRIGFLGWGVAIYLLGIGYSIPQVRLKGRFLFDIVAQSFACWVLPFAALVWQSNFIISCSCMAWCIFYPYQLSDFTADRKAGLRSTHVVLGLFRSLMLGAAMGLVGFIMGIAGGWWRSQPWTIALFAMTIYALWQYVQWFSQTEKKQLAELQTYVARIKPYTQLLVPYLLAAAWIGFLRS